MKYKIKPLKCFAVVNRKTQKLSVFEIFDTKDLVLTKDEIIIPVEIVVRK